MKNNNKELVVITGCDSGIGESLCELFLDRGYSVAAAYFKENPFGERTDLYAQKMDITYKKDLLQFSEMVLKLREEGLRIKYLINNAGIAMGGPVENVPMEIYRKVLEVNFFGLVSLTQKLIPSLIKDKGRIVIHGSMAGLIALPFLSPYTASKFALEGFCDSLRIEMRPFGVRVILLETGGISTPIWQKAKKQDISFIEEKYMKSMRAFETNFIDPNDSSMPSDNAALQIYKKITKKKPKARYIIAGNRLTTVLPLFIPSWLLDRLIIKLFRMDYGKSNNE